MSSIGDPNPPILTFVGRPTVPHKGIVTFFDCVALLANLSDLPAFHVWVLGGDSIELNMLYRPMTSDRSLRRLAKEGRVRLWSRVGRETLAEIYSRSRVLIVPSYREEFGLVAIEAMMCGCPVVASRLGGLQDVVLSSWTGTLVPPGDTQAMAFVLTTYLRSPLLSRWRGRNAALWASSTFSLDNTYSEMAKLYKDPDYRPKSSIAPGNKRLRNLKLDHALSLASDIIKQQIISAKLLTHSGDIAARVETTAGYCFLKFFSARPPAESYLFSGLELSDYHPRELVRKHQFLSRAPFSPELIAHDEDRGIVVYKWYGDQESSPRPGLREMERASSSFQYYWRVSEATQGVPELLSALRNVPVTEVRQIIESVDKASAIINRPLLGDITRAQRMHPQIELARIWVHLRLNLWPLRSSLSQRLQMLIALLLDEQGLVIDTPRLYHGSLKEENFIHVKDNRWLPCDFDHVGFFIGDLDIAHIAFSRIEAQGYADPARIVVSFIERYQSRREAYLALCWLSVLVIYRLLINLAEEGEYDHFRLMRFLGDLILVLERWYLLGDQKAGNVIQWFEVTAE